MNVVVLVYIDVIAQTNGLLVDVGMLVDIADSHLSDVAQSSDLPMFRHSAEPRHAGVPHRRIWLESPDHPAGVRRGRHYRFAFTGRPCSSMIFANRHQPIRRLLTECPF